MSNVTYSSGHRQIGAPTINIQSTLRTAPDLCQNVSLTVLFGSNGNLYTMSTQPDMCVYVCTHTHTHTHIYIYIHIHTHIHIYIYIYIHTHTHTYIYIHTQIHIYIHIYIYTHTHTHTLIFFTIYFKWSDRRNNKIWTDVTAACEGKFSLCHFGYACHRFFSPAVGFRATRYKYSFFFLS